MATVFHVNLAIETRQNCARASPNGTSASSLDTELMTLHVHTPAVLLPQPLRFPTDSNREAKRTEEIPTVLVGSIIYAIPNSCSASSTTSVTQSCIDIWQKSGGSKEGSWWRYARCPCEAHPGAGLHFQLHPGFCEAIAAWRASILYKEQVD
ncbi:hypothetical protein HDV63DRAFT_383599 [Trichoderma sp. SZMC 28014]